MTTPPPLLLCLGAFLLGAVPFGFLAGRMKGIDLRKVGSGNIGATNTMRALGVPAGVTVLILDVLKGYLPVLLAHRLRLDPWWVTGTGLAAILGHTFSPFLGFKGGKGVATSLGVLIGFSYAVAAATALVFLAAVAATRYVSLGSILGALTQAVCFWALPYPAPHPLPFRLFGLVVGLFVVVKHKDNIKRLLAGTESRFGEKNNGKK